MGWCVGVRALILNGLVTKRIQHASSIDPTWIHTILSHTPLSRTTLSHTTISHTTLSHTTVSRTTVTHTQFVTHNCSRHTHTQHCLAQLFHFHTHFFHIHTHTPRDAAVFCVADVAFGDFDGVFAWHTWHLVTLMPLLCGNRGTWWQSRCFCVAGVALTLLVYV